MNFSDQIRNAVRNSGLSRYRIALEASVEEASLCRFMQGGGLTTATLDSLASVLRFRLQTDGPRTALLRKHGR